MLVDCDCFDFVCMQCVEICIDVCVMCVYVQCQWFLVFVGCEDCLLCVGLCVFYCIDLLCMVVLVCNWIVLYCCDECVVFVQEMVQYCVDYFFCECEFVLCIDDGDGLVDYCECWVCSFVRWVEQQCECVGEYCVYVCGWCFVDEFVDQLVCVVEVMYCLVGDVLCCVVCECLCVGWYLCEYC